MAKTKVPAENGENGGPKAECCYLDDVKEIAAGTKLLCDAGLEGSKAATLAADIYYRRQAEGK